LSVLAKILKSVRAGVKRQARLRPVEVMEIDRFSKRSLIAAIELAPRVPLIAEVKRASPSVGNIRPNANVIETARAMLRGGAIALSVLTEPKYFKGDPSFLREIRNVVEVPVLRKDFIVDEYQLHESAELGADAVLLLARVLKQKLPRFTRLAEELGMECLVEVTSLDEVRLAVSVEARLVGINNRDLETLDINLDHTRELAPIVPEDVVLVSESGIRLPGDVRAMLEAGADAVLVGTALMQAGDIEEKVRSLVDVR